MRKLTKQERLSVAIIMREIEMRERQRQRDAMERLRQELAEQDRKRIMDNGSLWQWCLLHGWQNDDDHPLTPPMV